MEPPRRLQDGSIDPKIVSGAADGDSTQIERLVRTLIPLFRRQAYDACAVRELAVDPDLIEDLVVDVVHHLIEIRDGKRWRLWRWVQNQTAPFEHWVAVVAAHKLSDLADTVLRIRNSECDLFEDVIASPVEEDDEDRGERETLLRACLLKLDPLDQRILWHRYVKRLPSEAIAERLGLALKQVYRRTHAAKKELRRLMEASQEDV
jgi:RNA polymerase sigma factor (sigma-70 family)